MPPRLTPSRRATGAGRALAPLGSGCGGGSAIRRTSGGAGGRGLDAGGADHGRGGPVEVAERVRDAAGAHVRGLAAGQRAVAHPAPAIAVSRHALRTARAGDGDHNRVGVADVGPRAPRARKAEPLQPIGIVRGGGIAICLPGVVDESRGRLVGVRIVDRTDLVGDVGAAAGHRQRGARAHPQAHAAVFLDAQVARR